MFILRKGYVYTILGCLLLLTLGFEIKDRMINESSTVATVALPVNEKTIILDAGHGRRRWRSNYRRRSSRS